MKCFTDKIIPHYKLLKLTVHFLKDIGNVTVKLDYPSIFDDNVLKLLENGFNNFGQLYQTE